MPSRSVLITGAASGIGRACALALAKAGWRVGAVDVDLEALDRLRHDPGFAVFPDDRLWTAPLDVRDGDQWRCVLADFTQASNGQLQALVNNAGILQSGDLATIPLEAQQRTVEVNVTGVLNGCHTAYRYLKATPGAQVVNLCSASAIYGQPGLATYSATKFAVRGLTEALDLEWEDDGIRVRAVWPLFVQTGMVEGMELESTRRLGIRLRAQDVADVVVDLLDGTGVSRLPRPRTPHYAVGAQARALLASSAMGPTWLNRLVNRRINR